MSKSKTLKRKCIVCGKKLAIELYADGHYKNAHYFGKVKFPIKNKGEYKKVGTTRILGKPIDVVKWVGKEKETEYWECESCCSDTD